MKNALQVYIIGIFKAGNKLIAMLLFRCLRKFFLIPIEVPDPGNVHSTLDDAKIVGDSNIREKLLSILGFTYTKKKYLWALDKLSNLYQKLLFSNLIEAISNKKFKEAQQESQQFNVHNYRRYCRKAWARRGALNNILLTKQHRCRDERTLQQAIAHKMHLHKNLRKR